jgi:predicted nucleic acid-binding protein
MERPSKVNKRIGRVFADTNYWIALAFNQDQYHACAVQWAPSIRGPIITTSVVLIETANALARGPTRQECVKLIDYIRGHGSIRVVELTAPLFDRGWQLFKARQDKTWSLVDCISFVVMQDNQLQDALTADHHFEQAGFKALLRESPNE